MPEAKFKIKLGVNEYAIEFDVDALEAYEAASGRSVLDLRHPRLTDTLLLLWAAMRREQPELTVAQVKVLFPRARYREITKTVMDAVGDFLFGEIDGGPKAPSGG